MREEREDELEYSAGRIGAVRKISMVARPDGEHPQPIQRHTKCYAPPCDAGPERRDTAYMYQREWKGVRIHNVVVRDVRMDVRRHAGKFLHFRPRAGTAISCPVRLLHVEAIRGSPSIHEDERHLEINAVLVNLSVLNGDLLLFDPRALDVLARRRRVS